MTAEQKDRDRRELANDITQLRLLSTHVPFDTGNLRWTAGAVRAMQDQIAALTPAGPAPRTNTSTSFSTGISRAVSRIVFCIS